MPGSCEDGRTGGGWRCRWRWLGPHSTGTCRSSVTACQSTAQQLHRAVHKHRGRIKGGGTSESSINDNNWFSVSQLPPTDFTRWPRCRPSQRLASPWLQQQNQQQQQRRDVECRHVRRRRQQTSLSISISDSPTAGFGPANVKTGHSVYCPPSRES